MWQKRWKEHRRTWRSNLIRKEEILKDWRLATTCGWKTNIQSNRPSKKLDNKRYEPFRISKDIGSGAFQLELPEEWAIHNVFNKNLLTRCVELKFKEQHKNLTPLPTIINKEEEYEAEEVRKHRKCVRRTQYLVHWKGYGNEHDQWIAETGLPYAKEAVETYKEGG